MSNDEAAAVLSAFTKRSNPSNIPHGELMCDGCRCPIFAGQAMTGFKCYDCQMRFTWGNDHTPKRCTTCADYNGLCLYCNEELTT